MCLQMVSWKECQHVMPTSVCRRLGAPTGFYDTDVAFSDRIAVHCAVLTSILLNASHWVFASVFPTFFRKHRTAVLTTLRIVQHILLPATFLLHPARNVTCGFLRGCHLHNLVCLVAIEISPPRMIDNQQQLLFHNWLQVVAFFLPAICQVPFAVHLALAPFSFLMATLLTNSPQGTCAFLYTVAQPGSCSRLAGLFEAAGSMVYDLLWQYSHAMGLLVDKVCVRCCTYARKCSTVSHPQEQGLKKGLRACALSSAALHLTCLVAVSALLYQREVKTRLAFLAARGQVVVDSLSTVYTLRCITVLVSISLHVFLVLGLLVF